MAATGAPDASVRVPVAVACRVLGLSTQGYYKWLKDPVCQRDWDDAHLANELFDLHAHDPSFGYRFLADELKDRGHFVGEGGQASTAEEGAEQLHVAARSVPLYGEHWPDTHPPPTMAPCSACYLRRSPEGLKGHHAHQCCRPTSLESLDLYWHHARFAMSSH